MSDSFVRILEGDDGSVVSDSHNCSCLSTDHGDSGHDGGHGGHHAELVLLFPFVVLAVGAGSEMLVHKTPIPYTTFLLLIGGVIGGLMRVSRRGRSGPIAFPQPLLTYSLGVHGSDVARSCTFIPPSPWLGPQDETPAVHFYSPSSLHPPLFTLRPFFLHRKICSAISVNLGSRWQLLTPICSFTFSSLP